MNRCTPATSRRAPLVMLSPFSGLTVQANGLLSNCPFVAFNVWLIRTSLEYCIWEGPMRKLLAILVIGSSLGVALTPHEAVARDGGVAAGLIGGLAVGTLFGAAIASGPRYYAPAPVYVAPAPVYVAEPACYWTRGRPVWDGYRGVWYRPRIQVCD